MRIGNRTRGLRRFLVFSATVAFIGVGLSAHSLAFDSPDVLSKNMGPVDHEADRRMLLADSLLRYYLFTRQVDDADDALNTIAQEAGLSRKDLDKMHSVNHSTGIGGGLLRARARLREDLVALQGTIALQTEIHETRRRILRQVLFKTAERGVQLMDSAGVVLGFVGMAGVPVSAALGEFKWSAVFLGAYLVAVMGYFSIEALNNGLAQLWGWSYDLETTWQVVDVERFVEDAFQAFRDRVISRADLATDGVLQNAIQNTDAFRAFVKLLSKRGQTITCKTLLAQASDSILEHR